MKIIKLFLASSVVEFEHDRRELGDYIRSLNDIYIKRDIYFELTICEDLSNAIARDRKQEEYNRKIRACEYFYVLFGREAGAYTIEEFDVALQQFRESGAPHIYTYFRQLPEGQSAAKSVTDFMERLDKEIGHYYSTYSHLDSVKLNLLLELTRNPKVNSKLKFENGKALVDETPLLSLEHVPVYSKNDALQKCIAQRQRLDEELIRLRAAMLEHPEDDSLFDQRMTVSQQRNQLAEQIRQMETDILNLCSTIAERSSSGQPMTWREKQAGRMLDAGDYEGALALLNDEQRQKELEQAESIAENGLDRIRGYISENLLKIQTLKSKGIAKETVPEITACYEECVRLAEKHHVELEVLSKYADFLYDQRRYPQAIQIAERLRKLYELRQTDEEKWSALYGLLGTLYYANNDYRTAEVNYKEALNISSRLAKKNPDAFFLTFADRCCSMASLYYTTNRIPDAESLYLSLLKIPRKYAKNDSNLYDISRTSFLNGLALLYEKTNRISKAEALFREALHIDRRLAEQDPESYEPRLAIGCNNLATLLLNSNRIRDAETLFHESLVIRRRLAERNPEAYEPDLADSYSNLANLYVVAHRISNAVISYHNALKIFQKLAGENPQVYEPAVAGIYYNIAKSLGLCDRMPESESMYRKSLAIRRRLARRDPSVYEPDLAFTCFNLGITIINYDRAGSKALLDEALSIYGKYPHLSDKAEKVRDFLHKYFAGWDPNRLPAFSSEKCSSAVTHANLDVISTTSDTASEHILRAEALYKEMLRIYRELARKNPEVYDPDIATRCSDLAHLYYKADRIPESESLYWEALAAYHRLVKNNPKEYESPLANCYFHLAVIAFNFRNDKATCKTLLEPALAIYEKYPHLTEMAGCVRSMLSCCV